MVNEWSLGSRVYLGPRIIEGCCPRRSPDGNYLIDIDIRIRCSSIDIDIGIRCSSRRHCASLLRCGMSWASGFRFRFWTLHNSPRCSKAGHSIRVRHDTARHESGRRSHRKSHHRSPRFDKGHPRSRTLARARGNSLSDASSAIRRPSCGCAQNCPLLAPVSICNHVVNDFHTYATARSMFGTKTVTPTTIPGHPRKRTEHPQRYAFVASP